MPPGSAPTSPPCRSPCWRRSSSIPSPTSACRSSSRTGRSCRSRCGKAEVARDRLEELRRRNHEAESGGGPERLARQKADGKLPARERIQLLLDPATFEELDRFVLHRSHDFGMETQRIPGDGVVTGHGTIEGRSVFVFAQDFTVFGGSLSETYAAKICKIMDLAMKVGAPIIGLNDSGGARIQEGVVSLGGYADIFLRNTLASGVVPQISAIMGPCAGGAVYSPAITDFVFMVKGSSYMFVTGPDVIKAVTHEEVSAEELGGGGHARRPPGGAPLAAQGGAVYSPAITDFVFMVKGSSYMFVTGPDVIKAVTHEEVSAEELGGAGTHAGTSGVAHFAAEGEEECLALIRELLTFLPQNNLEDPPIRPTLDPADRVDEHLQSIVPEQPNKPYDIKELIRTVLDDHYFFEVHADYAQNIVVGF